MLRIFSGPPGEAAGAAAGPSLKSLLAGTLVMAFGAIISIGAVQAAMQPNNPDPFLNATGHPHLSSPYQNLSSAIFMGGLVMEVLSWWEPALKAMEAISDETMVALVESTAALFIESVNLVVQPDTAENFTLLAVIDGIALALDLAAIAELVLPSLAKAANKVKPKLYQAFFGLLMDAISFANAVGTMLTILSHAAALNQGPFTEQQKRDHLPSMLTILIGFGLGILIYGATSA